MAPGTTDEVQDWPPPQAGDQTPGLTLSVWITRTDPPEPGNYLFTLDVLDRVAKRSRVREPWA